MTFISIFILRIAPLLVAVASCTFVNVDAVAAEQPKSPFLFIMIDAKTEAALGPFPFDRAVLAKAVERAAEGKARAVVLKFFLDQPKSLEGDRALAAAMLKLPVALEACIPAEKDRPAEPNPLPHRFNLVRYGKSEPKAIGGNSGILPIFEFAERAAAIGFVDSTGDVQKLPMIEAYQTAYVKSLYTVCVEFAFDDGALVTPGREMQINDKPLELDEMSLATIEFPKSAQLETISFLDLVNGQVPADKIKDKVVLIGCDTARMPTVDTPLGKMNVHRAFNLQLLALHAHFAAR